jgi:hypothetical protein
MTDVPRDIAQAAEFRAYAILQRAQEAGGFSGPDVFASAKREIEKALMQERERAAAPDACALYIHRQIVEALNEPTDLPPERQFISGVTIFKGKSDHPDWVNFTALPDA